MLQIRPSAWSTLRLCRPALYCIGPRMKNLMLIFSAIVVLVVFCISLKNSLSVTLNGARSMAVCTDADRPVRRSARRRGLRFTKYRFRYTDQDGQEQSATIRYGAFWLNPEVGESVPIVYARDSPDSIYYDSVVHVWMFPAIFGSVLIALAAKRVIRRRPNVENDNPV